MSKGTKIGLGLAGVLGAGLAGFFLLGSRAKAMAANDPASPTPTGPSPSPATPGTSAEFRTVTTNDPAPAGDLRVFAAPDGLQQIGGAEKGSTVELLGTNGAFANINANNPGGRYPGVTGWVHAQFIT
jgi:hypothetical protein